MAESASVFPKIFDLGKHLIWGTSKDVATGHLLVEPGNQGDTGPTPGAFHDLGRDGWWMVAWGVTPMRWHLVGRHVPEHFFRPCPGLLRIVVHIDQGGIREPVEWRFLTVGRAVGGAIPIVDLANAWVTSEKDGARIVMLRHRYGAPATADGDPDGRVWLLVRTWPDVDLPGVEPASLEIKWPIVSRPGLHDQVMRFPQPLCSTERQDIGRRGFVGHAAHETTFQAAAGDDVNHGHLLGHTDGLRAIGNRIAENEQAGP